VAVGGRADDGFLLPTSLQQARGAFLVTTTTAHPTGLEPSRRTARVLVVHDHPKEPTALGAALTSAGFEVAMAGSGPAGIGLLLRSVPDVVVAHIVSAADGLVFVGQMRSHPTSRGIPLIILTASGDSDDAARALALGADDYVRNAISTEELVARVRAKLARPPVPAEQRARHQGTGLLTPVAFREQVAREIDRVAHDPSGRPGRNQPTGGGCVAALDLAERASVARRLGAGADRELRVQVSAIAATGAGQYDLVGRDGDGRLLVLMPDASPLDAPERLARLCAHVARGSFTAAGEAVIVTPVAGFAAYGDGGADADTVIRRAGAASDVAVGRAGTEPVEWERRFDLDPPPSGRARLRDRLRTPLQVFIMFDLGVVLPFVAYVLLDRAGLGIAPAVFALVVAAMLVSALVVWTRGLRALRAAPTGEEPSAPYPPASLVIAACLPDEAATVVQSVETCLRTDYPGPVQVVLAYSGPPGLPIEAALAEIAARDGRFVPFRVAGSGSKAQNVNAALGRITGQFVGVFDSDHHPDPDGLRRACRWLSEGYDVVRPRPVVRNADTTWVTRMVAVEYESVHGVARPGRAQPHALGTLGGSDGYWRTDVLRAARGYGSEPATDDLDAELRVLEAGGRVASDPALVIRELAPTTLRGLWAERVRLAQGWFLASRRHLVVGWRSRHLTLRQKLGLSAVLGWRQAYPWLSLQALPLLAFFAWKAGTVLDRDVVVPFVVLAVLALLSAGPGQAYFAHRLAVPELRRHGPWFLAYAVVSATFATGLRHLVTRVAQIRELTGDRPAEVVPPPATIDLRDRQDGDEDWALLLARRQS
jgi:cellulose synthase/poly-beta-1,6-N-acetylglucosamine synthase-like glycosyltransferase/PleD family two-component response regulator